MQDQNQKHDTEVKMKTKATHHYHYLITDTLLVTVFKDGNRTSGEGRTTCPFYDDNSWNTSCILTLCALGKRVQ